MTIYYQDDHVTLHLGDCREVLPALDVVPDLLLTDPPYSVSTGKNFDRSSIGKGVRRFDFFTGDQDWTSMTDVVSEAIALASEHPRAAYVWCGHRQFGRLVDWYEERGWSTRVVVWRKKCPIPAPPGVGWDSAAELCLYAFRDGRKWTPKTGEQCPNVIDADGYRHGQPGKVDHPTQKPIPVIEKPLIYSTSPGDLVLDPFAGSGTTLRVAKDNDRRAIGIEIEERYAEIAAKRLAQDVLDFGTAS